MMREFRICALMVGCVIMFASHETLAQTDYEVDDIMFSRPLLDPLPSQPVYPRRLVRLWQDALGRSEDDLQRLIADGITQLVDEQSPLDFSPLIPQLTGLLASEDTAMSTRVAVARALIALDVREASDELLAQSQRLGEPMATIVEPALGAWGNPGLIAVWTSRVEQPQTPRTLLRLALAGLTQSGNTDAVAGITGIVADRSRAFDLRLAAATALSQLQKDGLLELSEQIEAESSESAGRFGNTFLLRLPPQLLAATLLSHHRAEKAVRAQQRMAQEFDGAAAAIAVEALLEKDPELVLAIADRLLQHPDAVVRRQCGQALFEKPTPQRIQRLADLMNDRHRTVRRSARRWLVELAGAGDTEKTAAVHEGLLRNIDGDNWRGLEQACLLSGTLKFVPASNRIVELLDHSQPEVFVSAAWALRQLELPETLEPMLARAVKNKQQERDQERAAQQSQLMQAFGILRYAAASDLARTYVPKDTPGPREAAIWALSQIHEGQAPAGLVAELAERVEDEDPMNPELPHIKEMSVIAIGFLDGREAEPTLRKYAPGDRLGSRMGQCVAWALNRIFGEPIPPIQVHYIFRSGWFLTPMSEDPADYTLPESETVAFPE